MSPSINRLESITQKFLVLHREKSNKVNKPQVIGKKSDAWNFAASKSNKGP